MAEESKFVAEALAAAKAVLEPPLSIERGAALYYELTIDNRLELTVDLKNPARGASAFQTDLCVFEKKTDTVRIPRVVLEFKTKTTTHDVITCSSKARRHKQIYPYLRYGLVVSDVRAVPRRFFVHNESLDFYAAMDGIDSADHQSFFARLLELEVRASKRLESLAFEKGRPSLFRMEVEVDGLKQASGQSEC